MKLTRTMAIATTTLLPWLAQAHAGHGRPGLHAHDSDAWAYVAVAAAVAVTVWLLRRR